MTAKQLLIRCDASHEIGSGHFFRCLSIGAAAQDAQIAVTFLVGAGFPPELEVHARRYGARIEILRSQAATRVDALETSKLAGTLGAVAVVFDSYDFDNAYFDAVDVRQTLYIDDLYRSPPVDVIVNPNPQAQPAAYNHDTLLLLGPRYALLRPEFLKARQSEFATRDRLGKVLICVGGSDPRGLTSEVVEGLSDFDGSVVVVASDPNIPLGAPQATSLSVLTNVIDMASLMNDADLVFCGAGGTVWELCCIGTPFVALVVADNQEPNAQVLEEHGVPVLRSDIAAGVRSALEQLASREERSRLQQSISKLVDGRGAARVLSSLLQESSEISLRPATDDDCRFFYEVNNDSMVRAVSIDSSSISWEGHQQWYAASLSKADRQLLIIESSGVKAGVLRFDLEGDAALMSIALHEDYRGQGLGSHAIEKASTQALSSATEIIALVRPDNLGSMHAFLHAGFKVTKSLTMSGVGLQELRRKREGHA